MEEALRGTFAGEPGDPGTRAAQDGAFARLEDLVARWAAESKRDPLSAAAWWRAALARTLVPGEPPPAGWSAEETDFLGEGIPYLVFLPERNPGGLLPVVLVLLDDEEDPEAFLAARYGPLLDTHALVALDLGPADARPPGPVARDPRTALLALTRAARGRPLDRDRVVLDGFGRGAATAALLAADSPRQFCGVVLRDPGAGGEPAENLAANPVLRPAEGEEGAAGAEALRDWVAALPPRTVADPRKPFAWASVTGDRFLTWGHWFVVRRTSGFGPGRTVRVRISRDPERNAVVLETEAVSEILLLLNDEGLDLDRPVKVVANGVLVGERRVERSLDTLRTWAGSGERTLFAPAEWTLRLEE